MYSEITEYITKNKVDIDGLINFLNVSLDKFGILLEEIEIISKELKRYNISKS